jgi:hypothetical protein
MPGGAKQEERFGVERAENREGAPPVAKSPCGVVVDASRAKA